MRLLALFALFWLPSALAAFDHDHSLFDEVLRTHVDEAGMVDYAALKAEPDTLNRYLEQLAPVSGEQLEAWSREEQLAYWINAYNAYTLKVIIDHYPIDGGGLISNLRFPASSIRHIDGVWDEKSWPVAGGDLTLDQMEHEKMRAELDEPLIHFAVNCASIGCAQLRRHAYTSDQLDQQLRQAAKAFIADPSKVKVSEDKLHLSKIFEWFGEDFERFDRIDGYGKYDGVVSYVLRHLPARERRLIRAKKPSIAWIEYDWGLNDQD